MKNEAFAFKWFTAAQIIKMLMGINKKKKEEKQEPKIAFSFRDKQWSVQFVTLLWHVNGLLGHCNVTKPESKSQFSWFSQKAINQLIQLRKVTLYKITR